jgi:L-lactate dehydrogenase complex protein LldF
VITPHLAGMEEHKHLSYASSLCGACTSVCPVKINLHNLLLLNRKQSVEEGLVDKNEKLAFKFWAKGMQNRRLLNFAPASVKNFVLGHVQKETWSKRREPLQAAPLSFNEMWRKQRKNR